MILKITIISLLLVNIKAAPIKKILILTPMASEFAAFNKNQNNKITKIEGTNSFAFKIKTLLFRQLALGQLMQQR